MQVGSDAVDINPNVHPGFRGELPRSRFVFVRSRLSCYTQPMGKPRQQNDSFDGVVHDMRSHVPDFHDSLAGDVEVCRGDRVGEVDFDG